MKQKQRKWKKIAALCSVLLLLFSIWAVPVYAEETSDLFQYMKDIEKSMQDVSEITKNRVSNNAAADNAVLPIFTVLATDGQQGIAVFNAFYVQDTNSSGEAYLLTTHLVGDLAIMAEKQNAALEFWLMAENFQAKVTDMSMSKGSVYTVLYADGLEQFQPLQTISASENDDYAVLYSTIENNAVVLNGIELNMDQFQPIQGGYISSVEAAYELLGAPVVDMDTGRAWGMMALCNTEDGRETFGIAILNEVIFDSASGGSGSSGDSGEAGSSDEGFLSKPWMIGVLIGVVIVLLIKKKKGSKRKPVQPASVPVPDGGTVILDKKEEVPDRTIDDRAGIHSGPLFHGNPGKTESVNTARYQLRSMNGIFKGQIFEVRGTMKIGRDPLCSIRYPAETGGISGNHCLVMEEAEGILLRDLGSTYGTFYGGAKMQPQMDYHLAEGDTFYLADEKYSFRVERVGEYRQEFTPVVKAVTVPAAGMLYHANVNRELYFGRGNGTQVQFTENDTKISTKHCVLYRDNTGLYLMDLDSTNGTFLSETLRLKPNVPYRMEKGSAFFLATPKYTFVVTEE